MYCQKISYLATLIIATVTFAFNGGDGTAQNPYQISTQADLEAVNNDLSADYLLINDIDLSQKTYTRSVIGPYYATYVPTFTGSFNGNGFKIINLTIIAGSTSQYIGLFSGLGSQAIISDLGIENCNITGGSYVGSLSGKSSGTIINAHSTGSITGYSYNIGGLTGRTGVSLVANCYSTASVSGTGSTMGGLLGQNDGLIINSYSTGSVSGNSQIGGFVGYNSTGCILNCFSSGSVSATGSDCGGLAAKNYSYSTITNSYALGNVSGTSNVGGLVGNNYNSTVINSYAAGSVDGINSPVGGLVGYSSGSTTINSFWDTDTTGQSTSTGGIGLTTAQMTDINTFLNAGWDLTEEEQNGILDIWQIQTASYPSMYLGSSSYQPHQFSGDGTQYAPYLIYDKYDLAAVNQDINACYILMNDIDLAQTSFNTPVIYAFCGKLNAGGFSISDISINAPGAIYTGLFGFTTNTSYIHDINIDNCNIYGHQYTGGTVAINCGIIDTCTISGSITGSYFYTGGITGYNYGTIKNSTNTASVIAKNYTGGIAGRNGNLIVNSCSNATVSGINGLSEINVGNLVGNNSGTIANCYATGNTTCSGYYAGGLVGQNYLGSITNCYATGSASGKSSVGGIAGSSYSGLISCCYSTGTVTGTSNIGGLVGSVNSTVVSSSFWDIETSGKAVSSAGTGLSTAQMQEINTFSEANWDMVNETTAGQMDIWYCMSNNYPKLYYQAAKGDINYDNTVDPEDIPVMTTQWLATEQTGQRLCADINENGIVDFLDFATIACNFE